MAVTRRPDTVKPMPGNGGTRATAVAGPDQFSRQLLSAMLLFRDGQFGVRLPSDLIGVNGKIADAFNCRTKTVEYIRERLVTEGFEMTLDGEPKRRVRGKVLDGEQEAKIIALRLGQPPKGFANWTLRLLAQQAVTLEIVESVSHETLRRTLKKTR